MAMEVWRGATGEPMPAWAYAIVTRAYEIGRDDEADAWEASIQDME